MQPFYSAGEIAFLLSLTRAEAIDLDASQPDSLAHLAEDPHSGGGDHEQQLPTIARWHDVQAARRRVTAKKADLAIVAMRGAGLSEQEIAEQLGSSQPTVHRRYRATLTEVQAALGGAPEGRMATSRPTMCLQCGIRPRARTRAHVIKVAGIKHEIPERQLGLCAECVPAQRRDELLERHAA